jgi:hypothetical protein
MKRVALIGSYPLALIAFATAHGLMERDGINQAERAAYMVFQGRCENDPNTLCLAPELPDKEVKREASNPNEVCWVCADGYTHCFIPCDTDSDCAEKNGGDGGPSPHWMEHTDL